MQQTSRKTAKEIERDQHPKHINVKSQQGFTLRCSIVKPCCDCMVDMVVQSSNNNRLHVDMSWEPAHGSVTRMCFAYKARHPTIFGICSADLQPAIISSSSISLSSSLSSQVSHKCLSFQLCIASQWVCNSFSFNAILE
jgi:hypothetical protein